MNAEPSVVDVPAENRFTITLDGHVAELTYGRSGERIVLVHTGVPDEIDGRGLGSALVRGAVDAAAAGGLTVVPRCPFARRYLREHPAIASRVTIDWPTDHDG